MPAITFSRAIATRCGALVLAGSAAVASPVFAAEAGEYSAEEVTRALLTTGAVSDDKLQLHRWLTGVAPDPPAAAAQEIAQVSRTLRMTKAMIGLWLDTLYGDDVSAPGKQEAAMLITQSTNGGALRCIAHDIRAQPAGIPLQGAVLNMFVSGELPENAQVLDVQYRCISSYASALSVLADAFIARSSDAFGVALPDGNDALGLSSEALTARMTAAMDRDRHWPLALAGQLQLVSLHDGHAWMAEGDVVETLMEDMLASLSLRFTRPVGTETSAALSAELSRQAPSSADPSELVSQILLWLPPGVRDALRGDVEAYVAAVAPRLTTCQPLESHFGGDDDRHVRVQVRCGVPALDEVPVASMPPSLPMAELEQYYRLVLADLRGAVDGARMVSVPGFIHLQWDEEGQQWGGHAGAYAALQARVLLPTAVVDEWAKPSNISRFLPAVLRYENVDEASIDEESREALEAMRIKLAEHLRSATS